MKQFRAVQHVMNAKRMIFGPGIMNMNSVQNGIAIPQRYLINLCTRAIQNAIATLHSPLDHAVSG